MALTEKLSAIGQAIRDMTGKTEMLTLDAMPGEIRTIEGSSSDVRYVTFMSYDGTVEYGKKAVAVGDDCADPIARGIFATPTRESDAQYNYTFAGWATTVNGGLNSNALKAVTEDRTVYANYISALRSYTITYYDGDTVLKTETLVYGSMPSYVPTKEGYDFLSWTPTPVAVIENASYTATWLLKAVFETATWAQIAEIAASGTAERNFSVGDKRVINLKNGDFVECVIVGFNHDDLSDGTGKAPISIALTNVYNLTTKFEFTDVTAGYDTSTVRKAITDTAASNMPDDLMAVIKPVDKLTMTEKYGTFVAKSYSLWALSSREVGVSESGSYADGTRYQYYDDAVKKVTSVGFVDKELTERALPLFGTSTARPYWCRSSQVANNFVTYFDNTGTKKTGNYLSQSNYIHFGFCI